MFATIAGVFYNVKNGSSFNLPKSQKISVIVENWHFNSRFVLKTTKTPVQCLFSLLRFFDELFDVIIDDPFLML